MINDGPPPGYSPPRDFMLTLISLPSSNSEPQTPDMIGERPPPGYIPPRDVQLALPSLSSSNSEAQTHDEVPPSGGYAYQPTPTAPPSQDFLPLPPYDGAPPPSYTDALLMQRV